MATTTSSTSASSNLVSALGAGSGIDIRSLAQGLVEVEKQPRADAINKKITKAEARISGIAAIKSFMSDIQTQLARLKSASNFGSTNVASSDQTVATASSSPSAQAGTYDLGVLQVATATRLMASFPDASSAIGDGTSDITVTLTPADGGSSIALTLGASAQSPTDLVTALNASSSIRQLGITAQLLDTRDGSASPVKVILTGQTGESNDFSISASQNISAFSAAQTAQDAQISVNGLTIVRSQNQIGDAIPGVTLNLLQGSQSLQNGVATATSTTKITVTRDLSSIKDALQSLVTAYNSFDDTLNVLNDPKSTVATYGGALAGDGLIRTVRSTVYQALTGTSSTPGTSITALRDLGITVDKEGKLQLDEATLTDQLGENFSDVVTALTGNVDNVSVFSPISGGVAGDSYKSLDALMRTTGLLSKQTTAEQVKVTDFKDDLAELDDRMQRLLERYMRQFSVMDSLVTNSNAMRTSLKNTFDGMAKSRD